MKINDPKYFKHVELYLLENAEKMELASIAISLYSFINVSK
jgi:hypothetical protein